MRITFEFSDEELSGDAKAMLAAFLGVEPTAAKAPSKRGGRPKKAAETPASPPAAETPASPPAAEAPASPPAAEAPASPPPGDDEDFGAPADIPTPPPAPTLQDLQNALRNCASSYGSEPDQVAEGRKVAVGVLESLGAKKASALPEDKRAEAVAKLLAATKG